MKYKIEFSPTKKDFEDALNIEQQYLKPSTISSIKQVTEWDNKNHDIHVFVRDLDSGKIVGEVTILPLSNKQFNKFIVDKLDDTKINATSLLNYEANKKYVLLFSAIAIDTVYRKDKRVLGCLLNGLNMKLKSLVKRGVIFTNMCAEGQTLDGQKFIESFLNLKQKLVTKDGYKLYSFDSKLEFDIWLKKLPIYIKKYNKMFNLSTI